jgi:hypothetical protein
MDHGTNRPLIFYPQRAKRFSSTASCPTLFINRIINAWHQPHRADYQRLASTA